MAADASALGRALGLTRLSKASVSSFRKRSFTHPNFTRHPMKSIVLITGASGGIGRALAHQLHSQGLRVAVVGRDADRLADVDAAVRITADTTTPEGAALAVATCQEALGAPPSLLAHWVGQYINCTPAPYSCRRLPRGDTHQPRQRGIHAAGLDHSTSRWPRRHRVRKFRGCAHRGG